MPRSIRLVRFVSLRSCFGEERSNLLDRSTTPVSSVSWSWKMITRDKRDEIFFF